MCVYIQDDQQRSFQRPRVAGRGQNGLQGAVDPRQEARLQQGKGCGIVPRVGHALGQVQAGQRSHSMEDKLSMCHKRPEGHHGDQGHAN